MGFSGSLGSELFLVKSAHNCAWRRAQAWKHRNFVRGGGPRETAAEGLSPFEEPPFSEPDTDVVYFGEAAKGQSEPDRPRSYPFPCCRHVSLAATSACRALGSVRVRGSKSKLKLDGSKNVYWK